MAKKAGKKRKQSIKKGRSNLPETPERLFLYSTNPFLKFHIAQKYLGDSHFVWCSEHFDSRTRGSYQPGAHIPPTSNPAEIYSDLKRAVESKDRHNPKILQQIASYTRLAIQWEDEGLISKKEMETIIYVSREGDFDDWRPLLYVIPSQLVIKRVKLVPPESRARPLENEWIIRDLRPKEFDIIEP